MEDKERIDDFWRAVRNGWDIESREYFETKAPKTGDWSPEGMAVHYMWKREAKVKRIQNDITALRQENKELAEAVFNWCKDCELQDDCIAPDLKPCALKAAYKIALIHAEAFIVKRRETNA